MQEPMDVLRKFSVRRTKSQKKVFRENVTAYAEGLGYAVAVEKGKGPGHNVVIGNPATARYLITAHYDTPCTMPFPNFLTPTNLWAFLGYQLFTLVVMFGFTAVVGLGAMLLFQNEDLSFYCSYASLWLFLVLLMAGPANKNNANDNSSGVVTVLEIARSMPEHLQDQVCFVLFDLEEFGMVGSSAYQKAHKEQTKNQIILNLDCVGDGDEILLVPTGKLKKDHNKMAFLATSERVTGNKSIKLHRKGFAIYPSDQASFPYGVGIAAFRRGKTIGLYCDRIHTHKDTVLELENVEFLRDTLIDIMNKQKEILEEIQ